VATPHARHAQPPGRHAGARPRNRLQNLRDLLHVRLGHPHGEPLVGQHIVEGLRHSVLDDDGDAPELRGQGRAAAPPIARGLHSSTSQLNLSRF